MHLENVEDLTKWLTIELTPICDAEPKSLGKYVVALLKKPDKTVAELQSFTKEQLDVFLGTHTDSFVDKLFSALASKSYITSNTVEEEKEIEPEPSVPRKNESAIEVSENKASANSPSDGISSKNRAKESPEEKSPVKTEPSKSSESVVNSSTSSRPLRKRISPPQLENREKERSNVKERRRSRSPRDRRGRTTSGKTSSTSDRDKYRRRSRSRSNSRSPSHRRSDRSRRRCKDFEERGYCMRAEQCHYYHGPDPVVVDENALNSMVTLPSAANFSLPPPGYNPMNPPPPGVPIVAGEYNPETPALTVTNYSVPPPPLALPAGQWQNVSQPYVSQPQSGYGVSSAPLQSSVQNNFRGSTRGRGSVRGGRGGMVGKGYVPREGSTLQVAKIPPELNNISKLNEHFATFGTIDNIQVRYNGDPESALITFSSKYEAIKAHKSPVPVLNNRFIKVFWHKSPDSEDSQPTSMNAQKPMEPLKPSEKPKIATVKEAKFINVEAQTRRKKRQEKNSEIEKEKRDLAKLVALQAQQNALLDKWMVKQKDLLVRARTAEEETDRQNATKLVRQLHKTIKTVKDEVDSVLLKISEKTMLIDQKMAELEALKTPEKNEGEESISRKRKASGDADAEDTKTAKMSSVITVKSIKESDVSGLIDHMNKFGETFDTNVIDNNGSFTAVFSFKKNEDAKKAMENGKLLNGVELEMEITNQQLDEIPSTDTNMTANQLLAAIPSGGESDDDDNEESLNK